MSETIIVDRVGPYGVQANGTWYGLNKPIVPADFSKGHTYDVEFKEGKNGKKYISSVNEKAGSVVEKTEASVTVSYADRESERQRSQLIGGLSHDAATLVASLIMTQSLDTEKAVQTFGEVLKSLIEFRDMLVK